MDSTFHGHSNPSVSGGAQVSEYGSRHAAAFGDDAPPAGAPAPAAPPPAANSLQQAVSKAQDKAKADAAVASDPNASHHVKLAPLAPTVLGSTAAGALIGATILPGVGALPGAAIGWAVERYQVGGGPFGKAWSWVKGKMGK